MVGDRVSLPHVGALDGLRGAAVAGVVLYHGDHLTGGYLGVDLFFVLSGYLITSLLLAEWRSRGRISLSQFWARRARRLLPALALVLAGIAVYAVVFADPTELARIRGDALATIGYVANWRSITAHQSYFDLFSAPSPLQHTWSLAIEEQFYVLWPLLFVGIATWWKRHAPHAILVTALTLGAASTLLTQALYDPTNPNRVYFGTDTRAFALFAGIAIAAAVAIWGHPTHRHSRALLELAALISLALLTLMWTTLDGQAPRLYRGGLTLAGIAAALLIASAANPHRGPIAWALSFPPLRWLGLISYGLYLWHWPIDVVLTPTRTGITGWPLFTLRTTLALLIATASYHLIEMPIRRGALRPTQWRIAIPALTTLLIAALITTTAGATTPLSNDGKQYLPHPDDQQLLLGDSLAHSLAPGLDDAGLAFGLAWSPGCRLIHGELTFQNQFSNNCPWEEAWNEALKTSRPDNVILLAGIWDLFDVRPAGAAQFFAPGSSGWDRAFAAQLDSLLRLVSFHRAHLTLLTLPCTGMLTGAPPVFRNGSSDIERVVAANRVIRSFGEAHPQTVTVIDLFDFLCPRGIFEATVDGVATRSDGVHLSRAGADLVAQWLAPQLGAVSPTSTTTARSRP